MRGTEELDEGNLHARICEGRRGQPRLQPGTRTAKNADLPESRSIDGDRGPDSAEQAAVIDEVGI